MNIKDIKALTAVLTQADLSVLDYSEGDMHIRLERAATKADVPAQVLWRLAEIGQGRNHPTAQEIALLGAPRKAIQQIGPFAAIKVMNFF